MEEWQGMLPTHSRGGFPCGWKIGTRQTQGWWKKRGGRFGLRCPHAFLLLSQCPAPVLLSETSRSRGWCTSLPCTAAPRGPALLSTCRKVTLAGSNSANDSRWDSAVASFGQPQEGNRSKLTFSWMRCPAQQKEGTSRALPWELPAKDMCSQLAGGWEVPPGWGAPAWSCSSQPARPRSWATSRSLGKSSRETVVTPSPFWWTRLGGNCSTTSINRNSPEFHPGFQETVPSSSAS